MLTLGCARNEVDSEELAARLAADGWQVTDDGAAADVVLVNTCGFVEQAKQDSIDTLLAAGDGGAKVVAAGCMAERYGNQLAESLPEADAVLGFDDYPDISDRLNTVLAGGTITPHTPRDRRTLLPITPVERHTSRAAVPGHGDGDGDEHTPAHLKVLRYRLDRGPVASLKLASGCDRRCAFCAIPSFRGAYLSRTPDEVLNEAEWLATQGARELVLVSENSSSYGKDLGDPRALEKLLPQLAKVPGIVRVRVSYLQPAEMRPGLVEVIAGTPGLAPYFDLSFQHASEPVLRRMRRFGNTERFWELLASARAIAPELGARTNVIVGFPGESEDDVAELERFLTGAELDAIGVFGYSDEDGTEAATMTGKVDPDEVTDRVNRLSSLVDELVAQRAEDRVGSTVEVLVETVDDGEVEGRAAHQAPEVDGTTTLTADGALALDTLRPGDLVSARVVDSVGVDLYAVPDAVLDRAPTGTVRGGPR
ncbi:30S ribosomal protein S12 methylthiotransferase RimO [Actinocatenispora rupis]|uniref:Ribosomal protein uS12 methylthiotransferase RimO n=1 Tax=Actinocatenispora rupis TaxID=519421 RepID=A0A8J3IZG3_9ACTN|nr:30S ribosomal protein S12 methylthiotransferase RimO [Actinocatenispora rupis]GID09220.1 ribosomal protein S12 methylthiotransferase RimO [Actinocatenispora rupis]